MRAVPILALLISLLVPLFSVPAPAHAASCQFVLGFQALHDLIPSTIGDCLVDEHHNADNGDGLQETTGPNGGGGLLVWRKADNWTAFTDGYRTWVNGPFGLRERFNTQCFSWEAGCAQPISGSGSGTAVAITSLVGASPGGTASATVHTAPNAFCQIDYFGPHSVDRLEDGALAPRNADANGNVTWSWVISTHTPVGLGTVKVTCNGVTATSSIQIGSTPVSVAFTSVTGASLGGTASVTVNTLAGALCRIDYVGPRGVDRFEDGSLHPVIADSNGNASWSWVIGRGTPVGSGTATVNCNGVIATASIPISATTAPISVTIASVTGAARGGTASATVQTTAGAVCSIDYRGPLGVDRYEFGALRSQTANSNGGITWNWLIAQNTPTGNGTVTVTCQGVTATASVPIS